MKSFIDKFREEQESALTVAQLEEISRNTWLSIIALIVSIAALIVAIFK